MYHKFIDGSLDWQGAGCPLHPSLSNSDEQLVVLGGREVCPGAKSSWSWVPIALVRSLRRGENRKGMVLGNL